MLKVALKENQEKQDDIVTDNNFVLKLLKTTIFGKKAFEKRKESSKNKCVIVKENEGNKKLYL